MGGTREIMETWARHIEADDFEASARLLNPDGKWTVIGKTPVSGVYIGPEEVIDKLGSALKTGFKLGPIVQFTDFIVDGDRGFIRGCGTGTGAFGPYEQANYAFYFRVEGEGIAEFIEFLDTSELSRAAFGIKQVAA